MQIMRNNITQQRAIGEEEMREGATRQKGNENPRLSRERGSLGRAPGEGGNVTSFSCTAYYEEALVPHYRDAPVVVSSGDDGSRGANHHLRSSQAGPSLDEEGDEGTQGASNRSRTHRLIQSHFVRAEDVGRHVALTD